MAETNTTQTPDISVIIVNWCTREELRACLSSLTEANSHRAEIIVVDNASTDGSAEMVRETFPDVYVMENAANLGFAKAANQGIRRSRGRYVLLLNPDTIVNKGALTSLVRFGDENPDVGIFGPRILNPDGTLQYSCRRFPTLAAAMFRNTILGKLFPRNRYTREYLMSEWDHSKPRDVDWVSGAAMVIRRELLEDIGLLDETFFMYCEDVDICYRARQKGWRVAYHPEAVVVHAIGRSSDRVANRMIVEFHKSMYLFYRKHYAGDSNILVRAIVPIGLFLRARSFILYNQYHHVLWLLTRSRKTQSAPSVGCPGTAVEHGTENKPNDE